MKKTSLFAFTILLLSISVSHNEVLYVAHETSFKKNVFDNITTSYHSLNQPLMLKESKSTHKILVTTISTPNISSSTKIPRCGVRDGPLFYSAESQW